MGPEKKFETKVKKWLDSLEDVWYFKVHGNAATGAGIPDIIACVNSLWVGFEIKAEDGKLSEIQKAKFRQIFNDGGLVFVVYPQNFVEIQKAIEALNLAESWNDFTKLDVWDVCRDNLIWAGVKNV